MLSRSQRLNLLLASASIVVTLCLAEGVARLLWQPGVYAPVIRIHPDYGWALQPGSHFHGLDTDRGFDYRIAINALGHRDPEHQHTSQQRRVLVLGDSMTFGPGVEVGQRFTEVLGDSLGADLEVLNSGVGGWGTDQEFLYLCKEGFALGPDLVILTLCMSNDVLNNMLDHAFLDVPSKPRFSLTADGQLLMQRPHPPHVSRGVRVKHWLQKSRLLHYVGRHVRLLRERFQPPAAPVAAASTYYPEDLENDRSHWTVYRPPYSEPFEQAFRVTEALIAATQDSCRAHNVPFLVFAFPQKVEVDDEARSAELAHHRFDPSWFDLRAPYQRLERLCRQQGIPFLYPLEAFRAANARAPLFFARDPHPSVAGHAEAGRCLVPLVRQLLGEARHAPGDALGDEAIAPG